MSRKLEMYCGVIGWCAAMAACAGGARAAEEMTLEGRLALTPTAGELATLLQPAEGAKPAEVKPGEQPAAPPAEISFWNAWKRHFDVGLNGSDGNSQTMSVRAEIGADRKTETLETKAYINYVYTNDDGQKTKSRGEGFLRNDWLFKDSPWGFFAWGKAEYDEFQNWDWRLSAFGGPSYSFIKEKDTTLRGRVGLGASYEMGGTAEEKVVPEADVGLDYAHTFKEGHKIFVTADYFPSLDEFPAYRALLTAGYEILLSKESNMMLKLGLTDRYDSTPGLGFKRNDLEYFLTLSFNF